MKKLLLVCALALSGCTNENATRATLEGAGFTEIRVLGWAGPFHCGDRETCTKFHAVGPAGVPVNGFVSCGWFFKGCTIRQ